MDDREKIAPEARRQDIYGSREDPNRHSGPLPAQNEQAVQAAWDRFHPLFRFSSLIFILLVLGLLAVVLYIVFDQQRQLGEARRQQAGGQGISLMGADKWLDQNLPVQMDPGGRLVVDEMADFVPRAVPAGGVLKIDSHWVKQTAYHLIFADQATQRRDWPKAIENLKAVLAIMPDLPDINRRLGLACLMIKDYAGAEKAFLAAAVDRAEAPGILNNLAVSLMGQGKNKEAVEPVEKAIALAADYAPARFNRAILYYRLDDMPKAADALAAYRERFPDDRRPELVNTLSAVLMKMERWEEAAAVLAESALMSPDIPIIYFRLAEARARANQSRLAMEAILKGVRLVEPKKAVEWLSQPNYDNLRKIPEFNQLVRDLSSGS